MMLRGEKGILRDVRGPPAQSVPFFHAGVCAHMCVCVCGGGGVRSFGFPGCGPAHEWAVTWAVRLNFLPNGATEYGKP